MKRGIKIALGLSLVLVASAVPVLSSGSLAHARRASYPHEFEWGSALSAHQSEGVFGGGENGDWYELEHRKPSPIAGGDTADIATDFWHRYPEDIALAKKMGLTILRTSIAWEKVEPEPGKFNEDVIEHYRDVLKEIHRQGLKPMIALHHFTHPMWFMRKGHWLSPDSPRDFLRYARHVVERLSDLCDLWITFNEPMIDVMVGYVSGEYPPRIKSPAKGFEAGYNLVRAHRMAVAMIHEIQGASPGARAKDGRLRGVGLANSWQLYEPLHRWSPLDRFAAHVTAETMNWAFVRASLDGKWKIPFSSLGFLKRARRVPADDLDGIHGSPKLDWIGINYYSCYKIGLKFGSLSPVWDGGQGQLKGENGWAICPDGLETIIRQSAHEFPGYPLLVSENGLADASDKLRPDFIRDHLKALDRAVLGSDSGGPVDVRGYFHWSLTDNFEWVYGYQFRFGLTEIQYDNGLKRVPRASARVYATEVKKRVSR